MYTLKHNYTRRFHEIGAGLYLYGHINMKLQMLSDSGEALRTQFYEQLAISKMIFLEQWLILDNAG